MAESELQPTETELQRTHPLTVVVRTGTWLTQAIAGFVALAFFTLVGDGGLQIIGIALLGLIGAFVTAGFAWLTWSYFYYGIVGDHLIINEGWLVKKRRSIPLTRVQGVDIRADLISRLMGLADVVVQTAGGGGGEAEAKIGSITLGDAEKLRAQLISGRAHVGPAAAAAVAGITVAGGNDPGAAAAGAAGANGAQPANGDLLGHLSDFRGMLGGQQHLETEQVFEHAVPLRSLVIAALTSNGPLIALGAMIGVGTQFFELIAPNASETIESTLSTMARGAVIVSVIMVFLFAMAAAVVATVARNFGFKVRRAGQRLETESGLVERRMTSVPVRRIQAVIIEATPIRRLFKLGAVRVNTAGFGQSEEQQATTAPALIPIARSKEIRPLLHRLLPEAEQFPQTRPVPSRALRFYIVVPTVTAALTTLVLVGIPLAANFFVQLSEALVLATPLIVAVSVALVAGLTAMTRILAHHAAGFGVDKQAIAVTYGVLGHYRARIGRSRIQSLSIRQSPFQRRAGLATLHIATVSGSSHTIFRVRHMSVGDAAAIENWYSPDTAPAV